MQPEIVENCFGLLTDDPRYDDWEFTIGRNKAFYIRGATSFLTTVVERNIAKLDPYLKEISDPLHYRPEWRVNGFDWAKPLSPRQLYVALSLRNRKPILFEKAVQIFGLCEYTLRKRYEDGLTTAHPSEIFHWMQIQPAVYFIPDFDEAKLSQLVAERPALLGELCDATSQIKSDVFKDMAKGHTVTKPLADKAQEFLARTFPDARIRPVEYRFHSDLKAPSLQETLLDRPKKAEASWRPGPAGDGGVEREAIGGETVSEGG